MRRADGVGVLNIGRMGPGSKDYYLKAVARGVEDYYLARGEEPGRWLGHGAITLELEGAVEAQAFRRVLAGADPQSGSQLAAHPARKVPGFDLTFRAPKSVSLLWALSDRDIASQVVAAHDAAVDAALGYVERTAGWTRRGAGGAERVRAGGFVAAGFRHRTSRANDPLLHTHVLVANLARAVDDGIWRTLDSKALYAHAKTAGYLYQAHLRHELTRALGVAWDPVTNGYADLDGVPRGWIEEFSRRRAAIVEQLQTRGETSAKAAQVATLETRQRKELQASEAHLRAYWRRRAGQAGIDRNWYHDLLHQAEPARPGLLQLYRDLVTDEGLTGEVSTFARRDALRAAAGRLPAGAPVEQIEQVTDAILAHDPAQVIALGATRGQLTGLDVIRRSDGSVVPADADEPRYTTRGLLLTEQAAVTDALHRLDDGIATAESDLVEDTISRRTLTGEQAAMVRQLTGSGRGVEVVVGKAGAGKTYALDAARAAWQAGGIRVTGVALAARAALELQDTAGIPSTTLARLLGQLEDHRPGSPVAPGSVLVVDEAGMVGTRQLARLLAHAHEQRVKVVLVGDPHQLPEIDAGGLFRALATRLPTIELTDNRRQQERWEVDALDQLRTGDPAHAIATYQRHGRVVTADSADSLRDQLVDDWSRAYEQDGGSAVMVAVRRADVDELNTRARHRLTAAGRLTGPTLEVDGVGFQAGDRIVCLRNDRRIGVVNGTRATITCVEPHERSLSVVTDDGRQVTIHEGYLEAGHVAHGYAITGHKAQGLTVDHTFVLGSVELYREWGYVALSRGRISNRIYVHPAGIDLDLDRHGPEPDVDPVVSLTARLDRTRAHQAVSDATVAIAARWRRLYRQVTDPAVQRQRELAHRHDTLTYERDFLTRMIQREEQQLADLSRGLRRVRNRTERAEAETRLDRYRQQLAATDQQLHQVTRELARLPAAAAIAAVRDEFDRLDRQIATTVQQRVQAFEHDPPAYLTATLGPPSHEPSARTYWRDGAVTVETYRLRWGIDAPARALGDPPNDPLQQIHHRRATDAIEHAHRDLEAPYRARSLGISLAR